MSAFKRWLQILYYILNYLTWCILLRIKDYEAEKFQVSCKMQIIFRFFSLFYMQLFANSNELRKVLKNLREQLLSTLYSIIK